MQIKPSDKSIKTLLETGFYTIPRFQRPYSWDQINVDDFWQDTIVAEDKDYFIGSFVFWRDLKSDDLFYIVDGQQRLTTITILFAALRDMFDLVGQTSLAKGMHKLIETRDVNNESQFVLQSDTSYPYLQEHIQKHGSPEVEPDIGSEEKALKRAYDFLYRKIEKRVKSIELDTTIADEEKPNLKKEALLAIRDKLLRLKLIVIELDNDDDAYLVFETLNTRGKDLTVSDLVKNYIARILRPKTKGVDTVKDKWISIQKRFDDAEIDININSFILYSWLSRYQYTSSKKLYREIKKMVRKSNASAYLNDLVNDSKLYRKLLEPSAFKWDNQMRKVKESIVALNIFRVTQPLPMMLAVLREVESDSISKREAKYTFESLEKFHVQFTAITSQRIGGGTARLYTSSARQLYEATDKNNKNRVIREFVNKIRERKPSYEEFEVNFYELYFVSTQARQKALIRYIITQFDKKWRGSTTAVAYDQLTIEHIAPEAGGDDWEVSDEKVGMIGNLILVTEEVNNQLATKSFTDKLTILKDNLIPTDDYLTNCAEWDDNTILERTKNLTKLAYEDVFNF